MVSCLFVRAMVCLLALAAPDTKERTDNPRRAKFKRAHSRRHSPLLSAEISRHLRQRRRQLVKHAEAGGGGGGPPPAAADDDDAMMIITIVRATMTIHEQGRRRRRRREGRRKRQRGDEAVDGGGYPHYIHSCPVKDPASYLPLASVVRWCVWSSISVVKGRQLAAFVFFKYLSYLCA